MGFWSPNMPSVVFSIRSTNQFKQMKNNSYQFHSSARCLARSTMTATSVSLDKPLSKMLKAKTYWRFSLYLKIIKCKDFSMTPETVFTISKNHQNNTELPHMSMSAEVALLFKIRITKILMILSYFCTAFIHTLQKNALLYINPLLSVLSVFCALLCNCLDAGLLTDKNLAK